MYQQNYMNTTLPLTRSLILYIVHHLTSGKNTGIANRVFFLIKSGPCLCRFQHTAMMITPTTKPNTTHGIIVKRRFFKCRVFLTTAERKRGNVVNIKRTKDWILDTSFITLKNLQILKGLLLVTVLKPISSNLTKMPVGKYGACHV